MRGRGTGEQPKLTLHLPLPPADGAALAAQALLTQRAQIESTQQPEQLVAIKRLGQRRQNIETGIVQQAAGTVDQRLLMGRKQHDGQPGLLQLGLVHQQTDGILLHQTEIADQQADVARRQCRKAVRFILYPLTGEPQPGDGLLQLHPLKRVILEQQHLVSGQPVAPVTVTGGKPPQPILADSVNSLMLLQLGEVVRLLMSGRVVKGNGTCCKQPFPLPAGIRSGTVQRDIGGQCHGAGQLMGGAIEGIEHNGAKSCRLMLFRIEQRQ